MEVYNTLEYGFSEVVCREAFALELEMGGIPFRPQKRLQKQPGMRAFRVLASPSTRPVREPL